MLKIYGTDLCPDCVNCKKDLDQVGISYEYLNISEDLKCLKEFLKLRDEQKVFAQVKEAGKIGIPCLIDEDGIVSLTWEEYM